MKYFKTLLILLFAYLFHSGWRDDPEGQKARDYFEKAWSGALTNFKEKLSSKTT
jgi:hypothetical protein